MFSESTRQPSGSRTSASDSTNPRSTAEAMKGLPSASRVMASTTSSGSGPAIDSTNCLTSGAANGESRKCRSGSTRRSK